MDETVHRMQVCVASCVLRSSVEVPVQSHIRASYHFLLKTLFSCFCMLYCEVLMCSELYVALKGRLSSISRIQFNISHSIHL